MLMMLPIYLFAELYPNWFINLDGHDICGVGSGSSKLIAELNAKADFSSKIKINVDSNIEIESNQNTKNFKSETHLKSRHLVKDLVISKEEHINNTYFIMMCPKKLIK
jgi:hypothetical protein